GVTMRGVQMSSRGRGSDGQDDVDAAFAEIIADLERDSLGTEFGEPGTVTGKPPTADPQSPTETGRGASPDPGRTAEPEKPAERDQTPKISGVWRGMESEWDWAAASDSEHYVPPEPPPLPRPRAGTIAALVMLVLGVLLLVTPVLFGLPSRISTPIALVSLATGIGLLVLRMRSGPPPDTGWDDGAQV
ncbi:MAG: hypothetical protein ACRDQ5_13600, partial [Sciscionella sp.]